MPMPPVSISSKKRGFVVVADLDQGADAVAGHARHVVDDRDPTPASQLKSDDLPTFGRPTITTLGRAMAPTATFRQTRVDRGTPAVV